MLNFKKFLGIDNFTSKIDEFLNDFDFTHPKLSTSQQAEKQKYDRINDLRDHVKSSQPKSTLWDKF